jgi:hypothetical protein
VLGIVTSAPFQTRRAQSPAVSTEGPVASHKPADSGSVLRHPTGQD